MFSADLGGAPPAATPAATDPPFQKVALLLHGDGTNGAQNNTFVDSSTNNFTITRTGNVAQGTFSPFSLAEGQWSNYFDGSSYLQFTNGSFSNLGTNDWTVEFWIYPQGTSQGSIFTNSNTSTGFDFIINPSPNNRIRFTIDGGNTKQMDAYGVNNNVWTHFAMTRSGNNLYMYVNGTRVTSSTTTASISNSATYGYVGYGYGSYLSNTYVSNLRLVNGTALYTGASFTVPTSPLTAVTNTAFLSCQSNIFKDNSSNNVALTATGTRRVTAFSPFAPSAAYSASTNGGSAFFDGNGDYLTAPSNAGFQFGTGDFTIEGWYFPSNLNSYAPLFSIGLYSAGILVRAGGSGFTGDIYINGSNFGSNWNSSGAVKINQWNHVALVRSGTTVTLYANGVSATSFTSSANISPTTTNYIGASSHNAAEIFTGYIGDFRVVKGTAVYTANFTPPTAPLTAIANTQLLLNCTNAGIIDNAGKNDIETVGNAQISTSVKKYGTGSMYFDGSGDWLAIQGNSDSFAFGTGDFTIEMWIYFNDVTSLQLFYDQRPLGTQGAYPVLYVQSGTLRFNSNGTDLITTSVATGQWYHIAVSRSGTTTKLFKAGASVGTYGSLITYLNGGAGRPGIGAGGFSTSTYFFNGYIDDLRITKGQALYTSNFTPPTQAFPNV